MTPAATQEQPPLFPLLLLHTRTVYALRVADAIAVTSGRCYVFTANFTTLAHSPFLPLVKHLEH